MKSYYFAIFLNLATLFYDERWQPFLKCQRRDASGGLYDYVSFAVSIEFKLIIIQATVEN